MRKLVRLALGVAVATTASLAAPAQATLLTFTVFPTQFATRPSQVGVSPFTFSADTNFPTAPLITVYALNSFQGTFTYLNGTFNLDKNSLAAFAWDQQPGRPDIPFVTLTTRDLLPSSCVGPCQQTTARDFNFEGGIPEPGTWAMMLLGFGAIGLGLRRRKPGTALA